MSAWSKWEYTIAYLDKNEMGVKYVRTDKEHLGEMIEEIVTKNGMNIRAWREDRKYDKDWVQPSDVLKFNVVHNKLKIHPTQKPVELLEWLVKTYSNEGDTVLDNCMGSGSIIIACEKLGRNSIGIEMDKEIFDKAVERIENTDMSRVVDEVWE